MAARSVLKLLTKTYSCTLNSSHSTFPAPRRYRTKDDRLSSSISQPRGLHDDQDYYHERRSTRSLENVRDTQYREEEDEMEEYEDDFANPRNQFPPATDMRFRDPAREFKPAVDPKQEEEESNVYEVKDATDHDHYYDVVGVMLNKNRDRSIKGYMHLQPCNLKPYGSSENIYDPSMYEKRPTIVYPTRKTTQKLRSRIRDDQDYISYRSNAESTKGGKMSYSTATRRRTPTLAIRRRSSTAIIRKKQPKLQVEDVVAATRQKIMDHFSKRNSTFEMMKQQKNENARSNTSLFNQSRTKLGENTRHYNTLTKYRDASAAPFTPRFYTSYANKSATKKPKCNEFVTVKLSQLQEECRRQKRCKPKKINFGRLPKICPPDCPCIEKTPLKEGSPLLRLKKKPYVEKPRQDCATSECDTPRADAGYKVKRKILPQIQVEDCPCEEREMIDFTIRRLPKRKIPEPPKVCDTCEATNTCCPPRADDTLKIQEKVLPKLGIGNCPCIENPPLKDVGLKRLKAKTVREKPKYCPTEECPSRADDNLQIKPKELPPLKPLCLCIEPPPQVDVPPLKRLPRFKYCDPPRDCDEKPCDYGNPRSDTNLKYKPKKLPKFIPQNCPCIEAEIPDKHPALKRLVPKPVVSRKEICIEEVCPPRADDGMKVKPKQLPELVPGECPCVEIELVDTPPLKRLVAKPVKEPPRVCIRDDICDETTRERPKVERKQLPVLPVNNCPCVEDEPLKDVPLRKLKPKHVPEPKRVCPRDDLCDIPRADDGLKVEPKELPKLQINNCPCVELVPSEDVPLKRMKKVRVAQPPRVCPSTDPCDDIPRSDEDDWLYWKRVEVKSGDCDNSSTGNKRSFSTHTQSRRSYGTSCNLDSDFLKLKYDVTNLQTDQVTGKSYNIIIDIKPSVPLILTQTPLKKSVIYQLDEFGLGSNTLRNNKSETGDGIGFVIYNNKSFGCCSKTMVTKEAHDGTSSRFLSTCSILHTKGEEGRVPPNLQPSKSMIKEREHFIEPYPDSRAISDSARKSRMFMNERVESTSRSEDGEDCPEEESQAKAVDAACIPKLDQKPLTLWEKIVNYFKARPDCPSPEEFKKMRLREEAEKAASKAGLCLYDPKEMLRKNEELPKVITACKDESKK